MSDSLALFDQVPEWQTVSMADAEVKVMRGFYDRAQSRRTMQRLLEEIAWRQESIVIAGQERLQPRLSAWYGDAGSRYAYSGKTFEPLPWTAALLEMKKDIEGLSGYRFNSVLLNLYRNEHDSVGWHSDNEPELGAAPAIASLSLGETRSFRFRHKHRRDCKPVTIDLTDGALLLMTGATQRFWQHMVPKERDPCEARINLTFRTILPTS